MTVSVDDQQDNLGAVDFMVASEQVSYSSGDNPSVSLNFEHKLSKIVFDITILDGVEEITSFEASIANLYTEGQYGLDGQMYGMMLTRKEVYVSSVVGSDNRTVTVTAIIHPSLGDDWSMQPRFYKDGLTYQLDEFGGNFSANTVYTYKVYIGKDNVELSGSVISPWESEDGDDLAPSKEVWDGYSVAESFNGVAFDSDTENYEITNGEELAYLASLIEETEGLDGYTFTMLNNIDLGDHQWSGIGSSDYGFGGTFDGAGFKVKGLHIDRSDDNDDWWFGLFRFLNSTGTIKNLNVEGILICGAHCGGIVGQNNGGTIDNCSFYGIVNVYNNGSGYAGGIAGSNECGVISNCYNKGSIITRTTSSGIGGIVGFCRGRQYEDNEATGKVYACYNLGTVSSSADDQVGGIVGHSVESSTIESCFNLGSVSGDGQVGGIVGLNSDSHVKYVYNRGEISGNNYVGGIIGESTNVQQSTDNYFDATCSYVYNTGAVKVDGSVAAGVIGLNHEYASYCYAEEFSECGCYDAENQIYVLVNSSSTAPTAENIESLTSVKMVDGTLLGKFNNDANFASDDSDINDGYPILTNINY